MQSQNPSRIEWDACDIRLSNGTTIEVKSASYHQTWPQKKLSTITFGIGPARGWDSATNTSHAAPSRSADLYVFCLLAHLDRSTIDPLNLDQWEFYVLPTKVLNERAARQKTIGLAALKRLGPVVCGYPGLAAAIHRAATI
jgi:hypothetical protein